MAAAALTLTASCFIWWHQPAHHCEPLGEAAIACISSGMSKPTVDGRIPFDHTDLDIRDGEFEIHAARNETVAFQLIFKTKNAAPNPAVQLDISDLRSETHNVIPTKSHIHRFLAHYVQVSPGGYRWGPNSKVLPWPAAYPDALIPFEHGCADNKIALTHVPLADKKNHNQAVWVDIYVPRDQAPGHYLGHISLNVENAQLNIQIKLTVRDVTLPDKPTIDAVGELYRAYKQEGVGRDIGSKQWQAMAQCYQRLAHQHRMVFIERMREIGPNDSWTHYDQAFGPSLTGELFSAAHGYVGPGSDTPVSIWRTPWTQNYNVELDAPLSHDEVTHYANLAQAWQAHVLDRGWHNTDYFAYIFDEVDGAPERLKKEVDAKDNNVADYVEMVHQQFDRVQRAIDRASPDVPIELIWTSHSNPTQWADEPTLDLRGKIRFWAPNANAAAPDFLQQQSERGERIWFYHSGHPHIGIHSINADGIEMRTWGVIAARYGFHGQLMWAVNLGALEDPYGQPSYRTKDDRFGNGTLVYPGAMLDTIGFEPSPGPIPSMRLKAWRRGLQDAELVALARTADNDAAVNELLQAMIPSALADATGAASWPSDPAQWWDFRLKLLDLAESSDRSR